MKGVAIQAKTSQLASGWATKAGTTVCYNTLRQIHVKCKYGIVSSLGRLGIDEWSFVDK
jgi:hypothetical protein